METKSNPLKSTLEDMTRAHSDMRRLISDFFTAGGYQNQINLLATAIYDIVEKGSGEDDASLDNEFTYTNRYIRESVYELTELQRFLVSLHESYLRCRKCSEYMKPHTPSQWNTAYFNNKKID